MQHGSPLRVSPQNWQNPGKFCAPPKPLRWGPFRLKKYPRAGWIVRSPGRSFGAVGAWFAYSDIDRYTACVVAGYGVHSFWVRVGIPEKNMIDHWSYIRSLPLRLWRRHMLFRALQPPLPCSQTTQPPVLALQTSQFAQTPNILSPLTSNNITAPPIPNEVKSIIWNSLAIRTERLVTVFQMLG